MFPGSLRQGSAAKACGASLCQGSAAGTGGATNDGNPPTSRMLPVCQSSAGTTSVASTTNVTTSTATVMSRDRASSTAVVTSNSASSSESVVTQSISASSDSSTTVTSIETTQTLQIQRQTKLLGLAEIPLGLAEIHSLGSGRDSQG